MIFPKVGSFTDTNKIVLVGFNIINFIIMKVKTSVKKRSADCKIIRRNGKLYVINKKNPRFKQRQG